MKRFLSAAAAAALALSLNTAALAAGGYAGSITINGTALDTSGLPAASAPYTAVPLRSVAESDYGYAAWYPEEGRSFFSLDGNSIYVDCATGAIELNGEAQTGMTASFTQGVTFVPVELLNHLEGYTATVQDSRIAIVTPNGEALTKLARQIIAKIELGAELVLKPACQPVRETTGYPIASMAMAHRAQEICSPVESSMSISRLEALGLISPALAMRSSVVSPCAERTTTRLCPRR